jgi:hypothetical protein
MNHPGLPRTSTSFLTIPKVGEIASFSDGQARALTFPTSVSEEPEPGKSMHQQTPHGHHAFETSLRSDWPIIYPRPKSMMDNLPAEPRRGTQVQ